MALQLILDHSIPVVVEPGFWQGMTSRQLAQLGNAKDEDSHHYIWRDEPTQTIMLRPQQLDSTWLNTSQQLDSIIRLGQMNVNAADLASKGIFEAAAFGNNANPYIFHVPVGPSGAFPAAREEFPGAAPNLVGVATPVDPTLATPIYRIPNTVYEPLTTVPAYTAPPVPLVIGDTTDGKFLASSSERLPANQGLYFRWFQPMSQLGFMCSYEFYVGQYKLRIKDTVVEVFRDTSAHGDRSAWKKVLIAPLFSTGDFEPSAGFKWFGLAPPQTQPDHDRTLLWLPYRHNQVLLWSSAGKWALLTTRAKPRRLADNSDWDITRSDNLLVWVMTPAPGRFQVQKLKYPTGGVVQSPTILMDYTPTSPPSIILTKDSDHGTTLTATRSHPPSYVIPTNDLHDCPPPTTTSTDQRREYGVELTLSASGDRRWTPFFYGFQAIAPRTFGASPATPATVDDTAPLPGIVSATFNAGLEPGEGRLVVEVLDNAAQSLAAFYYRGGYPIQLKDGTDILFTGITEMSEVTPMKESGAPLRLTLSALDRWAQLGRGWLRDQRDWTNFGHIDVVRFIAEQGGVDCSAAEFPAGYTQGVISPLNSRLGLAEPTVAQQGKDVEQGWRPKDDDTAASYIKRIAELYSGWSVGFRLDGTFFYLPREYFTSSSVTFVSEHTAHTGDFPLLYGAPTFDPQEPEANTVLVKAADLQGTARYSGLWVDWASVLNPAAVNYLGRFKREVVIIGGTFNCAQLNWFARRIWEQTRRLKIKVSFEADLVPSLKVGQIVTLPTYGTYRITGFSANITKATQHRATYQAESTVRGY